jgi:GAF domain-containing protein
MGIRLGIIEDLARAFTGLVVTMPSEVSIAGADHDREPTVEELKQELADAREQQAATAEILQVISNSPTDLQRVFAEIAASAARLCDAYDVVIFQLHGDNLRLVAHHGPIPTDSTLALTRALSITCAVLDRRTIQVADLQAETEKYPESSDVARRLDFRTALSVPLIRVGEAIGVINIRRAEVRPFTDRQIDLLKSFADQAVIAIENARLFDEEQASKRELQESLQYQTAISEVLGVISRSPTDLQPVFDTIARSALQLCAGTFTYVFRFDGRLIHFVAAHGMTPQAFEALRSAYPLPPSRVSATARAIETGAVIEIPDVDADPDFEHRHVTEAQNVKSIASVPMVKDGHPIGTITVGQARTGRFPKRQIDLLRTFADQAVMAIENARLFEAEQASKRELQESLEYQTAISDVLAVISRSPSDLQPVLDAIVETAARLCQADKANIRRKEAGGYRTVASIGFTQVQRDFIEQNAIELDRTTLAGRVALDGKTVHIADVLEDRDLRIDVLSGVNFRTGLGVPLLCESELIGLLLLARERQRPFSSRQIALVETFADQAIIAIENTRLFEEVQASKRELQESLEYQTAISEVLGVISRSPTDVQPVFNTIARSALQLCAGTYSSVFRFDGRLIHFVAAHGLTPDGFETLRTTYPLPPGRSGVTTRAIEIGALVEIPDVDTDPDYEHRHVALAQNSKSLVSVPMLKDLRPIGTITVGQAKTGRFPERQIALLRTFADQAVIAIENTRLFEEVQARTKELTQALEQQTATSEVLGVISSSPGELQPVFQALLENAVRICEAKFGTLYLCEGDGFRAVAMHNAPLAYQEERRRGLVRPPPNTSSGRAASTKKVAQIVDIKAEQGYIAADPFFVTAVELAGFRTVVSVPMLKEDELVGIISIYRQEVRPFSDKQIDLVSNFAKQAVIAIENTRLLNELRESLQRQTATADVLKVISRSPTDIQPVFDTIAQSAAQLCEVPLCNVFRFDGHSIHIAASHSPIPHRIPPEALEAYEKQPPTLPGRSSVAARAISTGSIAEIPDVEVDADYERGSMARLGEFRSAMAVPMLMDGRPIGAIALARFQTGHFPERQIELMRTFADQAVIAIENTRLFEEVQARNRDLSEALAQQTATGEVLKVIGRSTFDLRPVLETLVENAARLCSASTAVIFRLDGDTFRWLADYGSSPALRVYQQEHPIRTGRGSAIGRAALDRRTIQIADVLTDPEYETIDHQQRGNFRTLLGIPMLKGGVLLGVFSLQRHEVRPFTEKQIELVETFADQAVIAIENVRLLEEAQERTRDLARSVQELQALGEVGRAVSSTLDLKVVLKTIVDRAVRLSGTDAGSIFYYRTENGTFELGESTGLDDRVIAHLRRLDISAKEGGLADAITKRQPLQISDLTHRPSDSLRDAVIEAGFRASLIVPLLGADDILGALILRRRRPGEFSPSIVGLMQSFADQSSIALENARLFEEIAQKSRELEIASQHKSQFVANMSHELRTPLAAILGYAELMQEGFYEPLGQKSLDALARIRSNGKHLLGLINTVLDIAKIESGQFTLNMAEYAIESVVETVRSATESLAQNKRLALKTEVAKSLPIGLGDEQRLTQVLLNIVGNAIKFTDAGEVRVTAKAVNGRFAVSVADTGPGIPEQEQTRIFDQFHQVDGSLTKAKGGTGLGLSIAKQIVEMHGGRIWVESTLGKGSTFQMELPTRAEFHKRVP